VFDRREDGHITFLCLTMPQHSAQLDLLYPLVILPSPSLVYPCSQYLRVLLTYIFNAIINGHYDGNLT
jgi:hypothetical protein